MPDHPSKIGHVRKVTDTWRSFEHPVRYVRCPRPYEESGDLATVDFSQGYKSVTPRVLLAKLEAPIQYTYFFYTPQYVCLRCF